MTQNSEHYQYSRPVGTTHIPPSSNQVQDNVGERIHSFSVSTVAIAALMSVPLALAGQQDLCPAGWSCKKNENGNSLILTAPEGENEGKGQVVWSSKETQVNLEDTLDANLRRIVPEGTSVVVPPRPEKTRFGNAALGIYEKESNSQVFMAGTFVGSFKAGGTIACSIYMPLLPNGQPSPAYIEFFDECENFAISGESFSKDPTLSSDTNKAITKSSVSGKPAPEIPVFKKLSGIKGIAIISNIELDVFSMIYKLKSRNILLFENGLFSNDLKTILEKGIAFSQKNNPNNWGKFKISNGKLSLKYNDSNQLDIQKYFTLYPPNPKNIKLLGCWNSSKTFEFSDGVSTGSGMGISGYCFDENGRFSKNNTFGFSGGIENSPYGKALKLPVGSYSSASEKSQLGWYRIDEYTIQLHYDDGATETKFIGIDDMLLLNYDQLFKIDK